MRVLHLTLKALPFNRIANGTKDIEYRKVTPYWTSRLEGKTFDEIHFKNGYSHNAPFMRVEYKGMTMGEWNGKPHYKLQLGRILEIKNTR